MENKELKDEVKSPEESQTPILPVKEEIKDIVKSENSSETTADANDKGDENVVNKLKQNGELDAAKATEFKTETIEKTDSVIEKTDSEQDNVKPIERFTRGTKRKANEISEKNVEQKDDIDAKPNETAKIEEPVKDNSLMKVVPEVDLMGKGKRARIPNKRYSDILLPTLRRPTGQQSKQTDTAENSVTDEEISGSGRSLNTSNSSAKKSKATKETAQDQKLLEPFKYGWVRELVWRKSSTKDKPIGDVYYYTPFGKKMRSIRDLMNHFRTKDKQLQIDNFSFIKVPINPDKYPGKEIIRDAIESPTTKNNNSLIVSPISKRKKLNRPTNNEKTGNSEMNKAIIKTTTLNKTVNNKRKAKLSPKKGKATATKKGKTTATKTDEPMEVDSAHIKPATTSTPKSRKLCEPCSLRCDGLQGIIPTLQCRKCLCLYHHECVGTSTSISMCDYVCQNCHQEPSVSADVAAATVTDHQQQTSSSSPLAAPPPLTPINTLKSVSTPHSTTLPTLPPKLQRIPRPDTSDPVPVLENVSNFTGDLPPPTLSPSLPLPPLLVSNTSSLSTNSTTPLYSSVDISKSVPVPKTHAVTDKSAVVVEAQKERCSKPTRSLSSNPKLVQQKPIIDTSRPQYVEYLGGRKFLVIPKHRAASVPPPPPLSISREENVTPTIPANNESINSSTESSEVSSNLTNSLHDSNSDIKNESNSSKSKLDKEEDDDESQSNNAETSNNDNDDDDDDDENQSENDNKNDDDDDDDDSLNESNQKQNTVASGKKRNFKLRNMTNNASNIEEKTETKFMENYLQNLSFGYNTMLYVFQYLKVQDLLRAGCVCTMWRDIASHPSLWRTVRMKNSQVHSFEGLANALKKHGTVYLDLRKMLLPSNGDDIWPEFSEAIARVDTLRKIELCRCPAHVIEKLAQTNPNLDIINAVTIKCETINLDPLQSLTNIKELRLRSTSGLNTTSIEFLSQLKTLKHLSLTSVNDLHKLNLNPIGDLVNLESLDLGECTDFPKSFGEDILIKLEKLDKLRLEKGQGTCHTFELLNSIKDMKKLEQLELVNFDVKSGFDKALGACSNIKKLMIIPTYISQSATTNNMVLAGVLRLQDTLTHFVWGVTLELLRVTELFVDQCEEPKEKRDKKPPGNGDSIPVLKPVPDLSHGKTIQAASNPPQVEILPLPNLQKLLLNSLPTTRVKILKIPFHATWRQTLTDTV